LLLIHPLSYIVTYTLLGCANPPLGLNLITASI
jgi:hypothetical protein